MKLRIPVCLMGCLLSAATLWAHEPQLRVRKPVQVPDLPGYVTLKCDFHIHTVFSDGLVWPSVRAEEAWRQGLDAIAITDHIEYRPHKEDITADLNRPVQIARGTGNELQVMVIHGSEITRDMPPGHINAIFLTNSIPLDTPKWEDAVQAASSQGAFIFWNHPGWAAQLKGGVVRWYPEHTALLDKGLLHGIEVVNARDYYPEAHRWAIEKKLTLLSNSDVHQPIGHDYAVHQGDHRPVTLVFAKARTPEALKEALQARRTVVYSSNRLVGDEQFLRPLFEQSIRLDRDTVQLAKRSVLVQISNSSEVDYELELHQASPGLKAPHSLVLAGGRTVLLSVAPGSTKPAPVAAGTLQYKVKNLLVGPDQPLVVTLPLKVTVGP